MPKRLPDESPQSTTLTVKEDDSELVCGACLMELFSTDTNFLGTPAGCPHLFHWTCLNSWAQIQNSCPQCKQRFRVAAKYDAKTRALVEVVKFRKRDRALLEDANEEDDSIPVELCEKCKEPGNDTEMILCDGMDFTCNALYHFRCVGFEKVPPGLWFCDHCIEKGYIPEELKHKPKRTKKVTVQESPKSLKLEHEVLVIPGARLFSNRLVVQSGATRRSVSSSSVPRQLKMNEWESLPSSSSGNRPCSRFETIERIRQRRLEMKRNSNSNS